MKEKIKIILITVFITGLITSLSWFLLSRGYNQRNEEEYIFSMKQECREVGNQLYEKGVNDLGSGNVLNPEYYYNKKLKTCLYAGGQIDKDYFEKWVMDSLSNKWIIAFIEVGSGDNRKVQTFGCPECLPSNEEFEQQKQTLFNE